jgi:hypothetical protein
MVMNVFVIAAIAVAAIAGIWFFLQFKELKDKFVTIFLIGLFLFLLFSCYAAFNGKDLSIKDFSDIGRIGKIYFAWVGSALNNVKVLTTQAIKMNWQGNKTIKLT